MPVVSFVPAVAFRLVSPPPPPIPKCPGPKPKPKPKPKAPRPAGHTLTPQVVAVMVDRVEAQIESGAIELVDDDGPFRGFAFTLAEVAELYKLFLGEAFTAPVRRPRPTRTAPGSAARIAAYRDRVAAGEELFATSDATAHGAHDRGLSVAPRRNGSGTRVLGWAGEGA